MNFVKQGRQLLNFVDYDYAPVRTCLFDVAGVAGKPDKRIRRKQVEQMRIGKFMTRKWGLPALTRSEQKYGLCDLRMD